MPDDSVTERILDGEMRLLSGIDGVDPYHYAVLYVQRLQSAPPTLANLPMIEIYASGDAPDRSIGYGSIDLYQSVLTWHAVGYVHDATSPTLAASRMAQDIRTAVESEQALEDADGTVMVKDTQWSGTTVSIMSEIPGAAFCDVTFQTSYMVQRTDTSAFA